MYKSIKNILFATDLSDSAKDALKYALAIADKHQAELTAFHVLPDVMENFFWGAGFEMDMHFDAEAWKEVTEGRQSTALEILSRHIDEVRKGMTEGKDVTVRVKVEVGHPVKNILDEAEQGYDMIVMGTMGHSKFEDMILGSVATGVVRRCKIPVMVVPLSENRE